MSNKGELAAVMARRLARANSVGENSQESYLQSQESFLSTDDSPPIRAAGDGSSGENTAKRESIEVFTSPTSGIAKNFFKAKEQEVITRRLSQDQSDLLKRDKEDAKKELQAKADKKKAFMERMAVFNVKK